MTLGLTGAFSNASWPQIALSCAVLYCASVIAAGLSQVMSIPSTRSESAGNDGKATGAFASTTLRDPSSWGSGFLP